MKWKITLDGVLLDSNYLPHNPNDKVLSAQFKTEINKSGTASFQILRTHSLAEKLFKMKSQLEIVIDDRPRFRGRVLDTTEDFEGSISVNCEGAFSYLVDSIIDSYDAVTRSVKDQLAWILQNHNDQIESWKQINLGNIVIKDANKSEMFENVADQTSQDAITQDLLSRFGGIMLVRYETNGNYLDWIETDTGALANQNFSIGVNIINLTRNISPNDIFTILKPVGDDGLTISAVNGGSPYIRNEKAISDFGSIIKSQTFSGIADATELKNKANDYIEKNYFGLTTSISLTGFDLHVIDDSILEIQVPNRVSLIAQPIGLKENYTCSAIDFNLLNPEQSLYTFGTINQTLTDAYKQYESSTNQEIKDTQSDLSGTQKDLSNTQTDLSNTKTDLSNTKKQVGENTKNISVNAENITVNAKKIEVNSDDIITNAKNIETNAENIKTNAKNIQTNAEKIETNATDILTNAKNIQTNAEKIETNATDIVTNAKNIQTNAEKIETNATDISVVSDTLDATIKQVTLNSEKIQINSDDIVTNAKNIQTNADKIETNATDISVVSDTLDATIKQVTLNSEKIQINSDDIVTNAKNIQTNADKIETNATDIVTNAKNITINATNIKTSADKIETVANNVSVNAKNIALKADKITLDGYVTASEFEAEIANVKDLFTNLSVSGNAVITGTLNVKGGSVLSGTTVISNCSIGGVRASWASTEVVTGAHLNLNVSKGSCYAFSTTTATVKTKIDYVADVSGSVSTDTVTLRYLGQAS